jgi:hypothetical protein
LIAEKSDQAVSRRLGSNSTRPAFNFKVKFLEQSTQSQKCSIDIGWVWNPKNLPPFKRMSCLGHFGLAHLEIIKAKKSGPIV